MRIGSSNAAWLIGFAPDVEEVAGTTPSAAGPAGSNDIFSNPPPGTAGSFKAGSEVGSETSGVSSRVINDVEAGVSAGFQLAAAAGPLCDEPLWGVAIEVQPSQGLFPIFLSVLDCVDFRGFTDSCRVAQIVRL